jgi:hypothetical protein
MQLYTPSQPILAFRDAMRVKMAGPWQESTKPARWKHRALELARQVLVNDLQATITHSEEEAIEFTLQGIKGRVHFQDNGHTMHVTELRPVEVTHLTFKATLNAQTGEPTDGNASSPRM